MFPTAAPRSFPGGGASPLSIVNDPEFFGEQNPSNINATTTSPLVNNVSQGLSEAQSALNYTEQSVIFGFNGPMTETYAQKRNNPNPDCGRGVSEFDTHPQRERDHHTQPDCHWCGRSAWQ